jgi:hypothetical protein
MPRREASGHSGFCMLKCLNEIKDNTKNTCRTIFIT